LFLKDALGEIAPEVQVAHLDSCLKLVDMMEHSDLPDLIFLDLNMPVFSGRDCMKQIRVHKKWKNVPVIIYSTSNAEQDVKNCMEDGADLYIVKPNSFQALLNLVKRVMSMDWKNRSLTEKEHFLLHEN
ncbi:MAG: response regulator, partial [Flavitalea sp.]